MGNHSSTLNPRPKGALCFPQARELQEIVKKINRCMILASELEHPEHIFRFQMNFSATRKENEFCQQMDFINRLVSILLNTAGGIIQLYNNGPLNSFIRDTWPKAFFDHVLKFVPKHIKDMCIEGPFWHEDRVDIVVEKSPEFLVFRTYLFARSAIGNSEMCNTSTAKLVIAQCCLVAREPLQAPELVCGATFPLAEGKHLEFKARRTTSLEELLRVFEDQRTIRSLLAFANTPGGGDLLVGIEDKTQKIVGQPFIYEDQFAVIYAVQQMLQFECVNIPRLWGIEGHQPKQNEDWFIRFLPVKCTEKQPTKFVILIHINHFKGGVFEKMPECYRTTDQGQIVFVPFMDLCAIPHLSEVSENVGVVLDNGSHNVTTPELQEDNIANIETDDLEGPIQAEAATTSVNSHMPCKVSQPVEIDNETLLGESTSMFEQSRHSSLSQGYLGDDSNWIKYDQPQYFTDVKPPTALPCPPKLEETTELATLHPPTNVDMDQSSDSELPYLSGIESLRWAACATQWKADQLIEPEHKLEDYIYSLTKSDIFKLEKPFHTTGMYGRMSETDFDKIRKTIESYFGDSDGFMIISSEWSSAFAHCANIQLPPHHLMDILVVSDTSAVGLWALFTNRYDPSSERGKQQKSYLCQLGRLLKMKLLQQIAEREINKSQDFSKLMKWECYIYSVEDEKPVTLGFPKPIKEDNQCKSRCIEHLKYALAAILLGKPSHFRDRLGNDFLLTLTSTQMETLVSSDHSIFSLIQGPPGSGKSIMATHLARRFAKKPDDVLYVTPNQAYESFLKHQVNCNTRVVCSEGDFEVLLKKVPIHRYRCIIMDDVQLVACSDVLWKSFFRKVESSPRTQLYIFTDNEFQNFKTSNAKQVQKVLHEYCVSESEMCDIPFMKCVSEVLRNTRKIASYMRASAGLNHDPISPRSGRALTCRHDVEGDDIYITPVSNLKEDTPKNGLVLQLENMTMQKDSFCYDYKDIAVLLDNTDPKRLSKDLAFFRTLLKKYIPEAKVQPADKFPVRGIVLDRVDAFHGLEAKVVVIIVPMTFSDVDSHSLANRKYKTFLASRAVYRLQFITDKPINNSLAHRLEYDSVEAVESNSLGPQFYEVVSDNMQLLSTFPANMLADGDLPKRIDCQTLLSHVYDITSVALKQDSAWVLGKDGSVKMWSPTPDIQSTPIPYMPEATLMDSPKDLEGIMGFVKNGQSVWLWDVATVAPIDVVSAKDLGQKQNQTCSSFKLSPRADVCYTGWKNGTISLWDARSQSNILTISEAFTCECNCISFTNDRNFVWASGYGDTIRCWDTRNTKKVYNSIHCDGTVNTFDISPTTGWIAVTYMPLPGRSTVVDIYQDSKAKKRTSYKLQRLHAGETPALVFSRCGKWLLSSDGINLYGCKSPCGPNIFHKEIDLKSNSRARGHRSPCCLAVSDHHVLTTTVHQNQAALYRLQH